MVLALWLPWRLATVTVGALLYFLFFLISQSVRTLFALLRPSYITSDDAGISFTTRWGTRSLRWSDIRSAELCPNSSYPTLTLEVPESVIVNLHGHRAPVREKILFLIVEKAGLDRQSKHFFVRKATQPCLPPELVGVGVSFGRGDAGYLQITAIEDHSPAYDQGLMRGDEVIEINGLPATSIDEECALAETCGPAGSLIHLKVRRDMWSAIVEYHLRTQQSRSD